MSKGASLEKICIGFYLLQFWRLIVAGPAQSIIIKSFTTCFHGQRAIIVLALFLNVL